MRDRVLIFASEPLRSALVDFVRDQGYEPRITTTPLQAIGELLDEDHPVGAAVIAEELPDGRAMLDLIGEEFPDVSRVYLAA